MIVVFDHKRVTFINYKHYFDHRKNKKKCDYKKMLEKENKKNFDEIFDNYYMKIKESLNGLEEILKISFLDNNIYFQLGIDNINNLHDNVLELMKHTYSPRQVRIKLRQIRVDELEAKQSVLE